MCAKNLVGVPWSTWNRLVQQTKRREGESFLLRKRLEDIDLFEGLWSGGDTFSSLAPVLGPE